MKPACNQRANSFYPLLKPAQRWHTETPILYTDINTSLHTHIYTHTQKSQAHHRDGGCGKRLRAWNRCPPAPPEPGHALAMPGCPGLPLGALIHCFHLLPGKWRAEMSKCMGITPHPSIPLTLVLSHSAFQSALSVTSTYQSSMRGKLYLIGITQCMTLSFKPSRQLSSISSFQLTGQFCTFSIMMRGGKRWRKMQHNVLFDLTQSQSFIKEHPVFAHWTKHQPDEKRAAHV